MAEATLKSALRPMQSAPTLWRLNGCGTTMLGRYHDPKIAPAFYSLLFVTFLLIPIWPLGIYVVSANGGAYTFHATIARHDFNAIYRHGYAKLVLNGVAETILILGAALAIIAGGAGLILFFNRH